MAETDDFFDEDFSDNGVEPSKTPLAEQKVKHLAKMANLDSSLSMFQSDKTILAETLERRVVNRDVTNNDGTLTSIQYRSQHGRLGRTNNNSSSMLLLPSLRRRKVSGSPATQINGLRALNSSMGRSKNSSRSVQSTLGRKVTTRNEERLEQLNQQIINNTKGRKFTEETSVIVDGEKIERLVHQPRNPKHPRNTSFQWDEWSFLLAAGEILGQENANPKICQDCISYSSWGDYECVVVCDGHGKSGEEVAWQVCNYISGHVIKCMIREVKSREPDDPFNETQLFDAAFSKENIDQVFFDCDDQVIWSRDLQNFHWAKIVGGEFEGNMCYIASHENGSQAILPLDSRLEHAGKEGEQEIQVSIFQSGERHMRKKPGLFSFKKQRPFPTMDERQDEIPQVDRLIKRKHLRCERAFYGGSTCVMVVRNKKTNQFKYATAGDSRILYVPGAPKAGRAPEDQIDVDDDETFISVYGKEYGTGGLLSRTCISASSANTDGPAILSVEHNIHDKRELARLERDFPGKYIVGDGYSSEAIQGYLYSNALFMYTGGLTPSRGFGDRLYYGSGYTFEPEVSKSHFMSEGGILIGGSDGVFDEGIWGKDMKGLVFEVADLRSNNKTAAEILSYIYTDTVRRCKSWRHFRIDDISLFGVFAKSPSVTQKI